MQDFAGCTETETFQAWGLALESEGGAGNQKLWSWYQAQGFTLARTTEHPGPMYAPLAAFMV